MTGPEEPDNLTSMESATETIKRIFEGSTSPVGAQIADESTRYKALEHAVCPKPAETRLIAGSSAKNHTPDEILTQIIAEQNKMCLLKPFLQYKQIFSRSIKQCIVQHCNGIGIIDKKPG